MSDFCSCCSTTINSRFDVHLQTCLNVAASGELKLQPIPRPKELEFSTLESVDNYVGFLKSVPSAVDDRNRVPISQADHLRCFLLGFRFPRKAKDNVIFVLKLLVESGLVTPQALCFRFFLDLTIMQQLLTHMESLSVSAGRIYQLVLTLIKVLHFLAFFGVTKGFPVQASSFPTFEFLSNCAKLQNSRERRRVQAQKILGPTANRCLTRQELSVLYHKCLTWFNQPQRLSKAYAQDYLAHLVVLILVSIPPPRTQVLRNLQLNHTLLYDGKEYMLSFEGETLKSKMPLLQVLPDPLTKPLTFWLQHCKTLLCKTETPVVFPKSNGTPRKDWRQLTHQITMRYLQKPVTPSKFRSCTHDQ
jgi:hypothetical protein